MSVNNSDLVGDDITGSCRLLAVEVVPVPRVSTSSEIISVGVELLSMCGLRRSLTDRYREIVDDLAGCPPTTTA